MPWKWARDDDSGHRFVTLNGEVVEPSGQIRLGTAGKPCGLDFATDGIAYDR